MVVAFCSRSPSPCSPAARSFRRPRDRAASPAAPQISLQTLQRVDRGPCRRDEFRGPRAGHGGRGADVAFIRRGIPPRGPAARQSRQLVSRTCRWSRSPPGQSRARTSPAARRRSDFQLSHRLYRRLLPRPAARLGRRQRHRLRRLRHQRAGARLERLCRPRRARQDRDHPGQRSRLADARPRGPVQRPGDDLLRPLDLQVRGSGAAGRRRRLHRPRHRARLLWLERGREQLVGLAALHAVGQQRRRPDRGQRLADQRGRAPPARRRRPGSRRAAPAPRSSAASTRVPLGLHASIEHRQPDPPHRLAQRDRHPARAAPIPTNM